MNALRSLALPLVLLSACATPPRSWQAPENAYGQALKDATRSKVIYRGLDVALLVYATFESPSFAEARRERLSEEFKVPLAEADGRAGELTQPTDGPTFLVAVNAGEREWNDLDRPHSTWQLSLRTPQGQTAAPVSVHRLPTRNPLLRELYPYVDPFFTVYRVVFPAQAASDAPTLVVAGPLGQGTLSF